MPLFISFFFALRGMAGAGLPDFANGGVAWFTNLSIPDPTYILPVISAAATLAVLQVSKQKNLLSSSDFMPY
jgi:YidC/Oxa1 family membrane protein insertase